MGRWRGETFLEYIREGLFDFSKGMSEKMSKTFGFVSLEGGVYNDVTSEMIESEYNKEVSAAAALECYICKPPVTILQNLILIFATFVTFTQCLTLLL